MRFFHISDLHIGKQLHFYNLIENQKQILEQIVEKAKEYHPDAIVIAGDIYDRSVPSGEAYTVFDDFLTRLSELEPAISILIIAGNHDSAQRLNYASSFLERHHIYISVLPPQSEDEYLKRIVLRDEWGEVHFYLLPFTKPSYVKKLFHEEMVLTYHLAVQKLIEREKIDNSQRNVLVAHQFFAAGQNQPETCASEQVYVMNVGGLDSVDIGAVEQFDYVALGHIHRSQQIGKKHIRYSGTPLKYSVSEEKHHKSITMVTLKEKGEEPEIELLPLTAMQDVRQEKGTLQEVVARANEKNRHDFVSIILTDEEELFRPKEQLDTYYDCILEVRMENSRTKALLQDMEVSETLLTPLEAFGEFYEKMQGTAMNAKEQQVIFDIMGQIEESNEKK